MSLDPTQSGLQDEWCADLGDLLDESGKSTEAEWDRWRQWLEQRFWSQHPDDPKGEEKKKRVWAAFEFLVCNRSRLEGVVVGKEKSVIDSLLIATLFRVFIGWPEDLLGEVPVDVVAREYRREIERFENRG